uniref:Uncharacterized protein n=1 Tax=Panagrolaimus sp. JU765 TaxID=591449 RepID=A0AC34Q6G3_9BILA
MLDLIKQQLKKIAKKNDMAADDKLFNVIQSIDIYDKSIPDELKTLDFSILDEDTVNLIESFLGSPVISYEMDDV